MKAPKPNRRGDTLTPDKASALGKKSRSATPWGKHPHCDTPNARRLHKEWKK